MSFHLHNAARLGRERKAERDAAPDETGWLIEENATGVIYWVALAEDAWPRTKENRFSRRLGFEDYLSPVVRVKDANDALRFARKQDAEAFMGLFRIFLLAPIATEHLFLASVDTLLTGGDAKQAPCVSKGSAVTPKAADAQDD
jgi:hypothetical protein